MVKVIATEWFVVPEDEKEDLGRIFMFSDDNDVFRFAAHVEGTDLGLKESDAKYTLDEAVQWVVANQ